jgi:hypothetical protein
MARLVLLATSLWLPWVSLWALGMSTELAPASQATPASQVRSSDGNNSKAPRPTGGTTKKLAVERGSDTNRWSAKQVVELRKRVGQAVTVVGRIERTSMSASGHHFLDFAESELSAICFAGDVAQFRDGRPADRYANQHVELSGTLELYRGKLQIKLKSPRQIRIVDAAAANSSAANPSTNHQPAASARGAAASPTTDSMSPSPATIKLKQLGPTTWLSPVGLRYAGRDPAGLTRLEHVARHFRDQPDRPGPHGVFDGGEGVAWAVIDEAWERAERQRLAPEREGDRSSFTVPMGRRIGYLGGRAGKSQGNPALSRVFMVFETGTKNIITAFPK